MEISYAVIFWMAALVIFLIVEAATAGLVSIWFAAGALAALLTAVFTDAVWLQILIFICVTVVTLLLTRPLAKRMLEKKRMPTNADMLCGMAGVVTEDIDNLRFTGAASVAGKEWTARSLSGEIIPKGAAVRVKRIEGVKLIVEPCVQNKED